MADTTRTLYTGFEPFAGWTENTSAWVVRALARRTDGDPGVGTLVLPVEYDTAPARIFDYLGDCDPDLLPREIVLFGMGTDPRRIFVESQASNLDDSASPDNAGVVRRDTRIIEDGPDRLSPAYPRDGLVRFLTARRFEVGLSRDAGTFVCNHTFYLAAWSLVHGGEPFGVLDCTFIHLPHPATPQAPVGGWDIDAADAFAAAMLEWRSVPRDHPQPLPPLA